MLAQNALVRDNLVCVDVTRQGAAWGVNQEMENREPARGFGHTSRGFTFVTRFMFEGHLRRRLHRSDRTILLSGLVVRYGKFTGVIRSGILGYRAASAQSTFPLVIALLESVRIFRTILDLGLSQTAWGWCFTSQ